MDVSDAAWTVSLACGRGLLPRLSCCLQWPRLRPRVSRPIRTRQIKPVFSHSNILSHLHHPAVTNVRSCARAGSARQRMARKARRIRRPHLAWRSSICVHSFRSARLDHEARHGGPFTSSVGARRAALAARRADIVSGGRGCDLRLSLTVLLLLHHVPTIRARRLHGLRNMRSVLHVVHAHSLSCGHEERS